MDHPVVAKNVTKMYDAPFSSSSSKLDTDTNCLFLLTASHTFRSIAATIQGKGLGEKLGPAIFIWKLEKLNRKLRSFPKFSCKIVKIRGKFRESLPYLLFGSSKFGTRLRSQGHALFDLTVKVKFSFQIFPILSEGYVNLCPGIIVSGLCGFNTKWERRFRSLV